LAVGLLTDEVEEFTYLGSAVGITSGTGQDLRPDLGSGVDYE